MRGTTTSSKAGTLQNDMFKDKPGAETYLREACTRLAFLSPSGRYCNNMIRSKPFSNSSLSSGSSPRRVTARRVPEHVINMLAKIHIFAE
jgi:hypothetical protein